MDYLCIETAPIDEECVQVSESYYMPEMMNEAKRFIEMLEKRFNGFNKIRFKIRKNPHDFGTYLSIDIIYDDTDQESEKQAIFIESNLPQKWDDDDIFTVDDIDDEDDDDDEVSLTDEIININQYLSKNNFITLEQELFNKVKNFLECEYYITNIDNDSDTITIHIKLNVPVLKLFQLSFSDWYKLFSDNTIGRNFLNINELKNVPDVENLYYNMDVITFLDILKQRFVIKEVIYNKMYDHAKGLIVNMLKKYNDDIYID